MNIHKELYELKMNRETIIREKIIGSGPVLYLVTPSEKYSECGPKLNFLKWFTSLKSAVEYGDILKTLEDEAANYIYINILLDDGKSLLLKKEELGELLDLEKRNAESSCR